MGKVIQGSSHHCVKNRNVRMANVSTSLYIIELRLISEGWIEHGQGMQYQINLLVVHRGRCRLASAGEWGIWDYCFNFFDSFPERHVRCSQELAL